MWYVLRTHGKLEGFWGIGAIGFYKSKHEAEEAARKHMETAERNDKLIVVKAHRIFKVKEVKYEEERVKCL